MLALNLIWTMLDFPCNVEEKQWPNLIVSIHWLPPTVLYCVAM
jgi:hypothetical protein